MLTSPAAAYADARRRPHRCGRHVIELTWPDGSRAGVARPAATAWCSSWSSPPDRFGTVEGLLGDGDGDPANDLVVDGEPLDGSPDAIDPDDIVGPLADEWRLTEPGLLPSRRGGESPATFEDPSFPDAAPRPRSPWRRRPPPRPCAGRAASTPDRCWPAAPSTCCSRARPPCAPATRPRVDFAGAVTSAVALQLDSDQARPGRRRRHDRRPPAHGTCSRRTSKPGTEVRLSWPRPTQTPPTPSPSGSPRPAGTVFRRRRGGEAATRSGRHGPGRYRHRRLRGRRCRRTASAGPSSPRRVTTCCRSCRTSAGTTPSS